VLEALAWLIGGLLALTAAFFIAWILVAVIVRVFAWVLVFWAVTFALGLAAGTFTGVVLPPLVLRGKTREKPQVATPDAVVAGRILGKAPRGQARHFGWDRAWPVYNPYQATRDANAVLAQAKRVVGGAFEWLFDREPAAAFAAPLLPAFLGFALGAWLSIIGWYLVMGVLGGLVYLGQQLTVLGYRSWDQLTRRRRKAVLRCAKCYRVSLLPSYRCANPQCPTVHHDIRPGPLGIVRRRCGCGTSIAATVGSAARHLVTVCPFCLENVPDGSGTRRVLPLPVIGSVSAGKTQFLTSGTVELARKAQQFSGSLAPISPVAAAFLTIAAADVASGQHVAKTDWKDRPEGAPFVLSLHGKEIELQLMDAAGESFRDWEQSQTLGYLDTAELLLFVLDPLALPRVTEALRLAGGAPVPLAQGDQEDAYASVTDRLRAEDVRLRSKQLGVVVTKFDVLETLPGIGKIDPADGDSIRAWLRSNGADGLVRRVDQDFRQVSYFAVDSYGQRDGLDPRHPVRVFDWALRTADPRLGVVPEPIAVPAAQEVA
jgi:hypothetical protein